MLCSVLCVKILSIFIFNSHGYILPSMPTSVSMLPHSEVLDATGNVNLFWETNETHIILQVCVNTKGWIAVGVSGNGDMAPADIGLGWVTDNGVTHFGDYHTDDRSVPIKDLSQDWFLVDAAENNNGTYLTMTRKLNTCDDLDDRPIQDGSTHVIYAYCEFDPKSNESIPYHGAETREDESIPYHGAETRGSKSVWLLSTYYVPDKMPDDVKYVDFMMEQVPIPATTTTYLYRIFQLEDIGKHHMIKYEPIITPGNELYVHHINLYYSYKVDHALNGTVYAIGKTPPTVRDKYLLFSWNKGSKAFYFPDNVGYSIGGPNDSSTYILEIHYSNVLRIPNIIDSSGIRLTITATLRQHEAGLLTIGHSPWSTNMMIPPDQANFKTRGYCSEHCLANTMTDSELKVFSTQPHAHKHAIAITARHFRNGTELAPLVQDPTYSYDFMEQRSLPKEITIKKEDSFVVECQYNTQDRSNILLSGLQTETEMCVVFLMYYPRIDIDFCTSLPLYNPKNEYQKLKTDVQKCWRYGRQNIMAKPLTPYVEGHCCTDKVVDVNDSNNNYSMIRAHKSNSDYWNDETVELYRRRVGSSRVKHTCRGSKIRAHKSNSDYWNDETVELYRRRVGSSRVKHTCRGSKVADKTFVETVNDESYQPLASKCP